MMAKKTLVDRIPLIALILLCLVFSVFMADQMGGIEMFPIVFLGLAFTLLVIAVVLWGIRVIFTAGNLIIGKHEEHIIEKYERSKRKGD